MTTLSRTWHHFRTDPRSCTAESFGESTGASVIVVDRAGHPDQQWDVSANTTTAGRQWSLR
ncbi:hypothetical protein OG738_40660 [Amycolatopsis sp. NBC_01488]|uniref:hypothetical protein n=1 Tax=Amycolatopsis sp. NBC_01488 TaxID=2903563 RepID=UPI002E2D8BAF|nr:hypothetical protein [Amycolatopsis sp. NBC_01488]